MSGDHDTGRIEEVHKTYGNRSLLPDEVRLGNPDVRDDENYFKGFVVVPVPYVVCGFRKRIRRQASEREWQR